MTLKAQQYLLSTISLLLGIATTFSIGVMLLHDDAEFIPQVFAWVVSILAGLAVFWIGLFVTVLHRND